MGSTAFFLQRLNDHILYLNKIKLTLDDTGEFCGSDYHLCELGRWLYGDGKEQSANISSKMLEKFEELFEPHKEFHESSSIAVEAHKNGNTKTKSTAFTKMHTLSNRLVNVLLELDRMAYCQTKVARKNIKIKA